ncbi:MAG: hypothetical protein ACREX8_01310 [Gammaproteobacteria bacterium]
MTHLPSAELLMVAWLKGLPGVPPDGVATTLPGDPATWAALGFVQVTTVGGSPAVHTPLRNPVVAVDCWANNPNSQKPPWGKASALAETIVSACYGDTAQRVVTMPAGYSNARLMAVYPLSEPRRVPADEAGFARLSVDLSVSWAVAA